MTTVACDVCGERYQVGRSAFGRSQKCKVCLVPFEVCSHTVAAEVDEAKADDEPEPSEFAVVQRAVGTGLTTLALIGCFAWMASLPFRNPRAAVASSVVAAPSVIPRPGVTPATAVPWVPAVPAATTPNTPATSSPAAPPPEGSRFDLSSFSDPATPAMKAADGSTANTATNSPPAEPSANATQPRTEPIKLRLGLKIQVRKDNVVRPAIVNRVLADGMVRVLYLDSRGTGSPLEDVKVEQIESSADTPSGFNQPTAATAKPTQPGASRPAASGQHNYNGPGTVPSSGLKVTKYGQLNPGLIVQVVWGGSGSWYPADVVKRNPNGTVRIHYRGWSASSDEDVPLEKIQLAPDGVNRP